jgi:hypothetical protein
VDTCSHAGQQVSTCLKFFAVASIDAWRQRYGQPLAVYRTSKSFATQQGALASWLRRAETQAAAIECRTYEAKAFRAALQEIRPLSCEADPTVFVPQMQALAAAAGVAVVFVPGVIAPVVLLKVAVACVLRKNAPSELSITLPMVKSKKPPRRTIRPLVVGVVGRFGTPSAPCGPAPVTPTGVWKVAAAVPVGATEVAGSAGGAAGAATGAGRAAGRACWALAACATSARPTTAVVPRRILRIEVLLIAGQSGSVPRPLPPGRKESPNT